MFLNNCYSNVACSHRLEALPYRRGLQCNSTRTHVQIVVFRPTHSKPVEWTTRVVSAPGNAAVYFVRTRFLCRYFSLFSLLILVVETKNPLQTRTARPLPLHYFNYLRSDAISRTRHRRDVTKLLAYSTRKSRRVSRPVDPVTSTRRLACATGVKIAPPHSDAKTKPLRWYAIVLPVIRVRLRVGVAHNVDGDRHVAYSN